MDKYAQVLNTYLTRRLLMGVMLFVAVIMAVLIVSVGLSSRPGTTSVFVGLFGPIFPAVLLGGHLKQQMASPEASLVPGFRTPHLMTAAGLCAIPVVFIFVVAKLSGLSSAGSISVGVFIWLSTLHLMAHPNRIALTGHLVCYLGLFVPPLRGTVEQILAGEQASLAWSLLSIEAAVFVLLFHHLATLSEDDPDYGNVMPMNPWDLRAAEVRRRNRVQWQKSSRVLLAKLKPISRQLDRLTQQPAKTRSERVALLRMGSDWPSDWRPVLVMLLVMELIPLTLGGNRIDSTDQFSAALKWPILLSLGMGWFPWIPFIQRWSRLGYESLRPMTRPQWVWENGLAVLRSVLTLQGLWLAVQVALLLIFLREYWMSPVILNGLLFLAGFHVLIFGASAWIASFGSSLGNIIGFSLMMGMMQPALLVIGSTAQRFSWQVPVIAIVSAVIGVGLTVLAYRRWCRMDLV